MRLIFAVGSAYWQTTDAWTFVLLSQARRIESFRSTFALAEERGGLCNFIFFGPAFINFPDTIHSSAPALFDKANKGVVTQWKVSFDTLALIVVCTWVQKNRQALRHVFLSA